MQVFHDWLQVFSAVFYFAYVSLELGYYNQS